MTVSRASYPTSAIFIGTSEMAQQMRACDWSTSPIGAPETWPDAIKVTIRLMLTSGFCMSLMYGPERTLLYNDAYRQLLGHRHPWALGRPTREVWPEAWPMIEARIRKIEEGLVGTWDEDRPLLLDRGGQLEETYHTLSYTPVIGESGRIEGILTIIKDESDRIISERRMKLLWELSSALALADDQRSVVAAVETTLRHHPRDLPFSLLYLLDGDGPARLAGCTGLTPGHPLAPERLTKACAVPWTLERLRRIGGVEVIDISDLPNRPTAACGALPTRAALVPLASRDADRPVGTLVVGLNPYRAADKAYLHFLRLLAGKITAALASAATHAAERRRAATLSEAARRRQQAAQSLHQANVRLTSEMALRTQERDQLRLLFEQAPSFMCLLRADDLVYELANRAYEDLVACHDLIGHSVPEALPHVVFGVRLETMMDVMRRGEAYIGRDVAVEVSRAPGQQPETRFVNVIFQPIRDADGTLTHVFIEGHDVTEQKRAERELQQLNETLEHRVAQRTAELAEALERLKRESKERTAAEAALRHAQKLEALGRLTGGIAHDFNNLLQVISGNLQLLASTVSGNPRAERRIANALEGVTRGSRLAAQLLAFGRRQPLEAKAVNVGRLILNMDDMLRRTLGQAIEIRLDIAEDLGNALIDPGQFENALLNLAINARDAMEGEGRLLIEARNAVLDEDDTCRHGEVKPGRYVMVGVTDTGSGIAPELLDQVFEPFFSTKSAGKGTGLGLSMVHGFVKQSGGHVKIDSTVGKGTTVRLYLPYVLQGEDVLVDNAAAPVPGGTETILVVEDDDEVRETTVALLRELGYRVLQASDARSALNILANGTPVDLLFTDVVLPGPLHSPELVRLARERLPRIKVLFTSGYTENVIVPDGRLDPGVDLLTKPYSREALARKIRAMLSQPPRPETERALPRPPARPRSRPERTVLLVEDEATIRAWTAEMLSELGYAVVEADSAASAIKALDTAPVDLLFTDIKLPGASGIDLARTARQRCPELPLIFTSGGEGVPASAGLGRYITLLKPYSAAELADALTQTIR